MSKLFYDHLLELDGLELVIKRNTASKEERDELWDLVDEMVQHKVLEVIFDKLPNKHHQEFLTLFHKTPHDVELVNYLKTKIDGNIEEIIKQEIGTMTFDVLKSFKKS